MTRNAAEAGDNFALGTAWVTGGRGFIGRHLGRHLTQRGWTVHGLGHGLWPEVEREQWGVDSWINGEVSIANLDELSDLTGTPRAVFHLAGGASVGASVRAPLEDFHRSVASTAQLLEWVRRTAPETRVVAVSSAAVYGGDHNAPIAETAVTNPASPYGVHKLLVEQLCLGAHANFGLGVSIARLFSVYGPGLHKQLIWDLCVRLAGHPAVLRLDGTGAEMRDWMHVSDAVRLLETLTVAPPGTLVNGGTGTATSIREVAELVASAWGADAAVEFSGIGRDGDPGYLVASVERAATLGFQAATTFEDGITSTVGWYRKFLEAV